MKIFHLRSSSGLYGAEHVILNICRAAQAEHDHQVFVIENYLNDNNDFYNALQQNNIKCQKLACQRKVDFNTISTLRKLLSAERPDILHCHDPKSVLYATLATLFSRKPIKVVTMHGWVSNDKNMRFNNFIEKCCLPLFKKIIAVSQPIKDALIAESFSTAKVQLIANGIDSNKFKPEPAVKQNDNLLKLLIVGRLSEEKGHRQLLKALKQINEKFNAWQLTIVGDGELSTTLKNLCTTLGLTQQVNFVGVQRNTVNFYQQHDVYISSSITEGMPLVVLEAMSCELPVISTPVGAIPSIIEKSNAGILANSTNTNDIKQAIEHYLKLTNTEQLQLANNARKYIKANLDIAAAVKQHHTCYQQLLIQA